MADMHTRSARKFQKDMRRLSNLGSSFFGLGDGRVKDYRPPKFTFKGLGRRRKAG
jgi:hypothetical protein